MNAIESIPSGIVPLSLKGAPSVIERLWPAQKISAESEAERKAVAGQTLTGLGGYWKGRKPLILNRACILGALLPATDDPDTDLKIFEALMQIDDEAFGDRVKTMTARQAAQLAYQYGVLTGTAFARYFDLLDADDDWNDAASRGRVSWSRDADAADRNELKISILAHLPYTEKMELANRPEQLGQVLPSRIWPMVNRHLGTSAKSLHELVRQLGIMRYGHVPRVGDAFSGSGQIPYEALRTGCDAYASDPNPIAALLTWSSFNIAGSAPKDAEALVEDLTAIERDVERFMELYETNEDGDRAKAYLYCLEVKCPNTGYLIPLAPNWVISPKNGTIGRLVPNHNEKRLDVEIVNNASAAEMKAAATGTVSKDQVIYEMDGQTYRFSIASVRGDRRGPAGRSNGLRPWESHEVAPRRSDIFGERLYCIQWATKGSLKQGRQTVYYATPTREDLDREVEVRQIVEANLSNWRSQGLVADMPIETGLETARLLRERGWTNWIHLFHPRQILMLAELHRLIKGSSDPARLYYFMPRALDNCSRLNRWKPSQGGGLGGAIGTFDNQALNTVINFTVRGSLGLRSLVGGPARTVHLDGERQIETLPGSEVKNTRDIWITDPPYADAVVYHELTEFFISWLRKNPPAPFDKWVWDSRRPLAIQGEGEDFRRNMVRTYANLAQHMNDDGLQIVMFTHQSGSVWADLAQIFWGAGLQVSAAWYIATETGSNAPGKRGAGLVQGTVIMVLRKLGAGDHGFGNEIAQQVRDEVGRQIDEMVGLNQTLRGHGRIDNLFKDADLQMAGYAAALRVLTGYVSIDGRDMTAEAVRPRPRGEKTFVDDIIEFAVQVANEHMVPDGLSPKHWERLTGSERFYLKMLDLEGDGESKLDNYQNFAKAFRVAEYSNLMASVQPNAARLKTAADFKKTDFSSEFGQSASRALLYGVWQLEQDADADTVLIQLHEMVPDYMRRRSDLIELADYVSMKRAEFGPDEARSAKIMANLIRNERL